MNCIDCKQPVLQATYHETNRLCQPCYQKWLKADEDALITERLGK